MSYVTGQAPKVYHGQEDLSPSINDDRAVRMLLNDNVDTAFPTGSVTVDNSLNLVTASNKSLTIVEGVQVTGDNVFESDMKNAGVLTFDPNVSNITYRETLQYRLDLPHNGAYRLKTTNSDISLDHPVKIQYMNALPNQEYTNETHSFRYLNDTDANRDNNTTMSIEGGDLSYGIEGKVLGKVSAEQNAGVYSVTMTAVSNIDHMPSGTLAASGITLAVNKPTGPHEVVPSHFGAYRLSYEDASMKVTQSYLDNNVAYVNADQELAHGSSLDSGNISFSTFVGAVNEAAALAYSGNMTTSAFNALNSSTVVIRSTPTLGNLPFQAESGNSGIVSLGSNKPDLTGVGDAFPKTALSVTVKNTHNLTEDAKDNSDYLTVDTMVEAIKEGAQNTDATVTFDSSDRKTLTNDNFGATVDVVYPADPLSGSAPNGVLSEADMKAASVSYSTSMKIPSTTNAVNAAVLSNTVVNSMAFVKGAGINAAMVISEVDSRQNNLVGKLIKSINISSDEKQDGVLLKINNSNVDIPDYVLDTVNNSFNGSNISGSINSAMTEQDNLASAGIRVLFQPLDMFASSTLLEGSSVGMQQDVSAPSLIRRVDNVIVYDINDQYQGPINLEHVPTSGLYVQKYEVRFPASNLKGNAANFQAGNVHPVPTHAYITAKVGVNSSSLVATTDAEGVQVVSILLNNKNVKINSSSTVGAIVTVDAEILLPLRLPGVLDKVIDNNEADLTGTAAVKIPLKYQYNNSYTWVGARPSRIICLQLNAADVAHTHMMIPQGSKDAILHSPTTGTWTDLCENSYPIDLRRGLDAENENTTLTLVCNQHYNLTLKLDVRGDENAPAFHNVDYVLGTTYKVDQWAVQYALADNNKDLFAANASLTKASIDTILTAAAANTTMLYGRATSVQTEDESKTNFITTVSVGYVREIDQMFTVAMANPRTSHVYFVRMTEALVMVNGSLHLLTNDESVKVADGVTAQFAGIQGEASIAQRVVDISLNNDKYSAIAYIGQAGRVYNTLGAIQSNKVLIPSGPEYAVTSEEIQGVYFQSHNLVDGNGVARPIRSYALMVQTSTNAAQFTIQSWTALGSTDHGKSWHKLHSIENFGNYADLNNIPIDSHNEGWRKVYFNCTSNTDCPMTDFRVVVKSWPFHSNGNYDITPLAFAFSDAVDGASEWFRPDVTKVFNNDSSFTVSAGCYPKTVTAENYFVWGTGIYYTSFTVCSYYDWMGNCQSSSEQYNGNFNPNIAGVGNIVTIAYLPCPYPSTVAGISSDRYRGFPDATTYQFHRAETEVVVQWGTGSQTISIPTVPSLGYSAPVFGTVNLDKQYGIKVYLSASKTTEDVSRFFPNIASVDVLLDGVVQFSTNANSFTLPTHSTVPFYEKFKLDHFFVPSPHDLTIQYKLSDFVFEKHHYVMLNSFNHVDMVHEANGSTGWTNTLRKSESDLLANNVVSIAPYLTFTFNVASFPHRLFGKKFFVTVSPMRFYYMAHGLYPTINQVRSMYFLENTVNTFLVSQRYALRATIDLSHSKISSGIVNDQFGQQTYYIVRDPLLLTIRGVYEMPPLSGNPQWHTYVDKQPFTTLSYEFDQYNTGTSSRELLSMSFDSLEMHPIYGGTPITAENRNLWYNYSSNIILRGWVETRLTQYVLKYELNADTKQVEPVVLKMVSQDFNAGLMGAIDAANIDGGNGTKDTLAGGWFKQFPITSAHKTTLSGLSKKLGKPYNFLQATDYPAMGFGHAHVDELSNLVFTAIDLLAVDHPSALDLMVNVRDYAVDSNGAVTYNSVGSGKYTNMFVMDKNKRRVLSIFAKDQLVVKDHLGNLSTRVGPDGQFYTSDVLAYSVRLQSSVDGSINRLVNGPANSQVALSAPHNLQVV